MTVFDTPDPGDLLEIENLTQVFDPINNLEKGTTHWAGTTGGSANTYTASLTPAPAALVAGQVVRLKIHAANTGASTLNLNGLGATAIRLLNAALAGGELALNATYILIYDGTYWQIIGGGGGSSVDELTDLSDVTITTPTTGQVLRKSAGDWVNAAIEAGDLPSSIDAAKIADGSVSNTEFQYLNGVTSAIQTQLDGKASSSHNHPASAITSGQLALAQGGTGADLSATGGSGQYVKQNSAGGVFTVGAISAGDLPTGIDASKLADGSVSNTELQYLGGVTSDVQTQLNAKPNLSLLTTAGDIVYRDGSGWQRLPIGTAGQVLKVNDGATAPEWGTDATDGGDLTDLGDVTITTPTTGQFLRKSAGDWINDSIAAGDLPTGIDATKLADGSVSNTELQYINSLTSNAQTQLDAKVALSTLTTAGDIAYRNGSTWTRLAIGTAGQVLKVNSGATAPEWGTDGGGSDLTLSAKTDHYTPVTADAGKMFTMDSSSNKDFTIDGSLNLTVGQQIHFLRLGTGEVAVVASGATVNSAGGLKLRARYSTATLLCVATDVYVLIGDTKV